MASRSWNRVELIGNLTRDPEMRYTPNGATVATFSIATNRTYMVEGERKEEADFHRCVAWNKLAELCSQLLKKGNKVFVSGRLQNRSWEDQSGQTRNMTEIVLEDMIVLTSREGGSSGSYEELKDDVSIPDAPAPKPNAKASVSTEEPKEPKEKPEKEDPGDLDDLPF